MTGQSLQETLLFHPTLGGHHIVSHCDLQGVECMALDYLTLKPTDVSLQRANLICDQFSHLGDLGIDAGNAAVDGDDVLLNPVNIGGVDLDILADGRDVVRLQLDLALQPFRADSDFRTNVVNFLHHFVAGQLNFVRIDIDL